MPKLSIDIPKKVFDVTQEALRSAGEEIPNRDVLEKAVLNVIKIKIGQLLDDWEIGLEKETRLAVTREIKKSKQKRTYSWAQLDFLYLGT